MRVNRHIKKNEEKLIAFLNQKFCNSKTNQVSIGKGDLPDLKLTEEETVQTLYILREDGLIEFVKKSVHDDFSMFWTVALKSDCVHYFELKRSARKVKAREWIWWGVTSVISVAALIVGIIAL